MRVKAEYNGFSVEAECNDEKECMRFLGGLQEVFSRDTCGLCGKPARPSHRNIGGNDYYSMACTSCGAEFKFGQRRDGGKLFPKDRDEYGQALPDGGWSIYQKGQ